jgi:hypothetical protein
MLLKISFETGSDYELIEDIYCHEFEFVSNQLKLGEKGKPETFENILLKHFGSFVSNSRHINKLKEIQDEKERSENCLQ